MNAIYKNFLGKSCKGITSPNLVDIYHAVRNITYGSTGVRDPIEVIKHGLGSCTGKHLVLRDILRASGHEAEIITMFTYFSVRTPVIDSYPDELKQLCREEKVPDFHHYARVRKDGKWLKLDATWHDSLIPFGFPVNNTWAGNGDTILASDPIREYPNAEDLVARKLELVGSLSEEDQDKRVRFFNLLTEWILSS